MNIWNLGGLYGALLIFCFLTTSPAQSEERYYPEHAQKKNVEGLATISCAVTVEWTLKDCVVKSEDPPGQGFGDAALRLAPKFKMRPASSDGKPKEGQVTIPIRFKLPPPSSAAGQKADPRIIRWAREEISAGQALSQKCASDLKATGQPNVLQPATVAADPTFERQRDSLKAAAATLRACEIRFKDTFLPKARADLENTGLNRDEQEVAFDNFDKGFMHSSTEDLAALLGVFEAEDAVLVHLQSSRAKFDFNKSVFVFPNPIDVNKFRILVDHVKELSAAIRAKAEANQAAANAL
jgi:TonB family protein